MAWLGTVTNDNASAGVVGEFLSVTVAGGSAVSLASGTAKNVTSLVLTPGDWDVRGYIAFNPAGTTTQSLVLSALNTTSGVIPQPTPAGASETVDYPVPAGIGEGYSVPTARISVATNTTVYLITNNTFSGGANAAYGYIAARRTR